MLLGAAAGLIVRLITLQIVAASEIVDGSG
jgi:hypothetical protein